MRKTSLLLASALAVFMAAGCSDPMAQPATDAKGDIGAAAKHVLEGSRNRHILTPEQKALQDPDESKDVASTTPADKPYKIGVCLSGVDSDFDAAFGAGVKDEAQKRNVSVDVVSAGGSASKQAGEVASLSKDNAIIVAPVNAESGQIKSAVPVIGVGETVPGAASNLVMDEANVGKRAMFAILGAVLKKQSGTVGLITYAKDPVQSVRADGFKRVAGSLHNVKQIFEEDLQQNTAEAAAAQAAKMIHDHPNVDAIFVTDDKLAFAVQKTIASSNAPAELVSVGASPGARDQIKAGKSWFADVIEYPHAMGVTSVDAAVKAAQGGKLPPTITIPVDLVFPASFR